MKNKRNILITILLLGIFIVYTLLLTRIDVKAVGPLDSSVGFSSFNISFWNLTNYNDMLYKITQLLGLIPFGIVFLYCLTCLKILIDKKDLKKIPKEYYYLAIIYIIIGICYIFFEKVIINYRPVLEDNLLAASYPSSHTLMAITICLTLVLLNNKLYPNKNKYLNIGLIILMLLIVLGRLFSGMHWFTDIIGGIILSSVLVMLFYTLISKDDYNE